MKYEIEKNIDQNKIISVYLATFAAFSKHSFE